MCSHTGLKVIRSDAGWQELLALAALKIIVIEVSGSQIFLSDATVEMQGIYRTSYNDLY
jgi:hypothetical protein